MSLSFQDLRRFKELGLSYSTVMVLLFLEEHGPAPIGKIADVCGFSTSSVEKALAKLKSLKLLPLGKPQKIEHDHVSVNMAVKGTADAFTASTVADCDNAKIEPQADDPIRAKLIEHEVLPWCIDQLMVKCDRQLLALQIEYHEHRLTHGFKFRSHPARFLFSACLQNYAPPDDYYSSRHKAQQAPSKATKVSQHPPTPLTPSVEAAATPEQKIETVQQMLSSPVPGVRRLALKLAADWGLEVPASSETA